MSAGIRRRAETALGADELMLIIVLVLLSAAATPRQGTPSNHTFLKTGLHTTAEVLARAPESRLDTLVILLDGNVRVRFADRAEAVVPGVPCEAGFDLAIERILRQELSFRTGPAETVIGPRRDTPMCAYLDTQAALERVARDGVIQKRVHFELDLAKEK